jgi:CRISPR-associated endonuclease/helicase Cas3
MKGPPTGFWGKLRQGNDEQPIAWHPLPDHCADVAACCEALLQRTLLRQRLAQLGGLDDLSAVQVARLSVLAAFHDIGTFRTPDIVSPELSAF